MTALSVKASPVEVEAKKNGPPKESGGRPKRFRRGLNPAGIRRPYMQTVAPPK